MTPRVRGVILWTVTLLISLVGVVATTVHVRRYTRRPYLYDTLYLPSGRFIETASLGYRELVSDFVWFQAVQYYGGYRREEHNLRYFEGLVNIVTDLDPHFAFAYIFGAVVLASDMDSFRDGVGLLRKGMGSNPQNGWLPFELGFLSYVNAHDDSMAARYFELASKLPGGGDRAKRFAAFVYSRSGSTENSIRMWEELLRTSDEPFMKDLARHYIEELRSGRKKHNDT